MEKLNSRPHRLKILFIVVLFAIFVFTFARPSINNFINAGVIVEKSSARREMADSPAITICALNKQSVGWKNTSDQLTGKHTVTWVDEYCKSPENVEGVVACLDEETFNLTETIDFRPSTWLKFIPMDKASWSYDVTSGYQGRVFTFLFFL